MNSDTRCVPHELFRHVEFPFPDDRFPHHLGAVIQRTVLTGQESAREVVHTQDNDWLVGDGVNDPNLPDAAVVADISHLAEADPAVAELAALPLGHIAERTDPGLPWAISLHEWYPD
jgi:hypothetical protein